MHDSMTRTLPGKPYPVKLQETSNKNVRILNKKQCKMLTITPNSSLNSKSELNTNLGLCTPVD